MSLLAQINTLKEKRAALVKDARAEYDNAQKNGWPDSESKVKWERMVSDAEELGKEAETLEKQDAMERSLLAAPGATKPVETAEPAKPSKEARNAAFRRFIVNGPQALTADEARDLAAGTDNVGGYMVPPEDFRAQLIQKVDNLAFMRQLSTVLTINSGDALGAPALDTDPSAAAWTAEAGTISADSTMAFGKRTLTPNQLTKLVKISQKLLRVSAIPADSLVIERISYLLANALENGYLNGSGSGEPLGVFTASANGINTDRDVSTGNSITAIAADNLFEVKYAVKGQYHGSASWLFHRTAVKNLAKLKDGDGQYLWQPGLQMGAADRLIGHPVFMSELVPSTFTTGLYVGIFGDFKRGYWIADLIGIEIQRLVELYAANSQVGIIGRVWSDGMPVLSEAFARVKLA